MTKLLIGIDDTDNVDSPGTGRLARDLCAELCSRGLVPLSVTRHQFLQHPAIRYTSHNSGACLAVDTPDGDHVVQWVLPYVASRAAPGSDPGVCLARFDQVSPEAIQFGHRAAASVLVMDEAFAIAADADIGLYGLGGTCEGVIGALGSVGQYAGGNAGRFIDLPGLRDLHGRVSSLELARLGIELDHQYKGREPRCTDAYETLDWVRPKLSNGKPVWTVEWSIDKNAWIPTERKKSRPLE